MSYITLVRHGETDYNKNKIIQGRIDIPLNATGRMQAKATSRHLINSQIDLIITSPLIRSQETAHIIAKEIGYNDAILLNEDFIERDFGEADGQPISLYIDNVHGDNVIGLESNETIKQRIINGILKVVKQYPHQNILIVCHSHTIKAVLAAIEPESYNFITPLKNCSLTTLEYVSNQLKIKQATYNDYVD